MANPFRGNTGGRKSDRSVGQHQTYINSDQRTAASKDKPHEPTDALISFHAAAIINPDNRQVLDIVKHLKQCDAYENVLNTVIAIPPKGDAADEKRHLHLAGTPPS